MRLGLQLGYTDPHEAVELAIHADRLGLDCVWTSEAWGADAVTVASWIAARTERIDVGTAIMQIPAAFAFARSSAISCVWAISVTAMDVASHRAEGRES